MAEISVQSSKTQKGGTDRKKTVSSKSRADYSQALDSPVKQILYLQRTIGNRAVTRLFQSGAIQARFKIGKPNDIYEKEADRVSERVMRMRDGSSVNGHWSLGGKEKASCPECREGKRVITPPAQKVQRVQRDTMEEDENKEPEEENKETPVFTKAAAGNSPEVTPNIESHINSMKGGGQPLSESTRSFFEPRFGTNFSHVRVHTDNKATQTAQSINARAFTTGKDIVFNSGQYSPGTSSGKRLMAHELTHVVQQNTGGKINNRSRSLQLIRMARSDTSSSGESFRAIGIVSNTEGVNLRDKPLPGSQSRVLNRLVFNTRLVIDRRMEGGWFHVTLMDGEEGYIVSSHVNTNIPEPGARLHMITANETAIGIAEQYYGSAVEGGQDLRFFVNVLEYVNRGSGNRGLYKENNADNWRDTRVRAGYLIWIPSLEFARSLRGRVDSGSITGGAWAEVRQSLQKAELTGQMNTLKTRINALKEKVESAKSIRFSNSSWQKLTQSKQRLSNLSAELPSGSRTEIPPITATASLAAGVVVGGAFVVPLLEALAALIAALKALLVALLIIAAILALLYLLYLAIKAIVDAITEAIEESRNQPPIFWPVSLPIPGPIGMPITRTKPANPRISGGGQDQVRTQIRASGRSATHVAHHILPLMLGGTDVLGNVSPLERLLHEIGHPSLNLQPQMVVWGYHSWIIQHPPPLLYFLAGIKIP